jgi:hypothetical protein
MAAIAQVSISDATVRRRLWAVLIVYEILVITIVAFAGLNIALAAGGDLFLAAPLALIACAEGLRVPLAAMAVRLRWTGRMLAGVALLAISILSAEGLSVALEAFLQNRVAEIARAAGELERAKLSVDAADANVASLAGQVKEIDAQIAALAKSAPVAPAASNRTCTWKGQKVSCSADADAVAAYRAASKAHDGRLASLTGQRITLQAKVDAARSPAASAALLEARRTFEEKASQSPVVRLTAAVFSEDVSAVTPEQFSTVKKYVVATLAIAFAVLSMVVSIAVHAETKQERKPGRVANAMRSMFAARRKAANRLKHRVEFKDRTVIRYLPVDAASGKVLDDPTFPAAAASSTPNFKVVS